MLKYIVFILFLGLVQNQAGATDSSSTILIPPGNTKVSDCTMVGDPAVTAAVYTDTSKPFTTWEKSDGYAYFAISTTNSNPPLGISEYLVDLEYDFVGEGVTFWTSNADGDDSSIQSSGDLALTHFEIDDSNSPWLMGLGVPPYPYSLEFKCQAVPPAGESK